MKMVTLSNPRGFGKANEREVKNMNIVEEYVEKFIGMTIEDAIEKLDCYDDILGWGYIDFDGALLAIGLKYGGELNFSITDGIITGYEWV